METTTEHYGQFPAATEKQWQSLAKKALRGAEPESLRVDTIDGITIEPLYTRARDVADTLGTFPYTRATPRHTKTTEITAPSTLTIRQCYTAGDLTKTNALILQDLKLGITGLQLDLRCTASAQTESDLAALLDGVYLDMVPISLLAGEHFSGAADALIALWTNYANRNTTAPGVSSQLMANFNADPIAGLVSTGHLHQPAEQTLTEMAALAKDVHTRYPASTAVAVDTAVYHDAGATDGQELALMLATGKLYLQAMVDAGMTLSDACRQIEFTLAVDTDFFASVATARAARTLWAHMTRYCGAEVDATAMRLALTTSSRMLSRYDVWTNQLRNTVAASAALLSNADVLRVQPFDSTKTAQGSTGHRMARNTTNILLEESGLHRVLDPLGGSGFIESLTEELCANAWSRFQALETAGGLLTALRSAQVQKDIASSRAVLLDAVAHRQVAIVGVSEFPDTNEIAAAPSSQPDADTREPLTTSDAPAAQEHIEPLLPLRLATSFETLRQSSDATAGPDGKRPTVTGFCFGTPAEYLPQLQFCENLLAAAGVVVKPAWPADPNAAAENAENIEHELAAAASNAAEDHAAVALICLPPTVDSIDLPTINRLLRAQGIQSVFSAGKPEPGSDAATIDGYLYRGCDAVGLLQSVLRTLEVE